MKNDIEFIEDGHIYLYKGVIIPSVSEIVKYKFPFTYKGVPDIILNNKAKYGTKLHECVEDVLFGKKTLEDIQNTNIDPNIKVSVEQSIELSKDYMFYFKDTEQMITYKGLYAGRYDLRTIDDVIVDIKTTQILHFDNKTLQAPLNLQLSLYYLGSKKYQNYGYAMHLPKGNIGKIEKIITWKKEDVIKLVEEYHAVNN